MPIVIDALTSSDVSERFFWYVRKNFRNQNEAADHYGVSSSFISSAVTGKKTPNARMLEDIGVEKVTLFRHR